MKILSIDFDFFADTDAETRNTLFPKAEDRPFEVCKVLWEESYKKHPKLKEIGVTEDFERICHYVEKMSSPFKGFVADSHKEIWPFLHSEESESDIELVHVDYHHDFYAMYGGKVTCANWLLRFSQEKALQKEQVIWICREDSERESLFGSFPHLLTADIRILESMTFDKIFLCRSPEWTPMHLEPFFNQLAELIRRLSS